MPDGTPQDFAHTFVRTMLAVVFLILCGLFAVSSLASVFVDGLSADITQLLALLALAGFAATMTPLVRTAKRRRDASLNTERYGLELTDARHLYVG